MLCKQQFHINWHDNQSGGDGAHALASKDAGLRIMVLVVAIRMAWVMAHEW